MKNKTSYWILLFCGALILLDYSAYLFAQEQPPEMKQNPPAQFEFSIKLDKVEWSPGESILIRFVLKNLNDKPVRIADITIPTLLMTVDVLKFTITEISTGKTIGQSIKWDKPPLSSDDFIIMNPNQYFETSVELSYLYRNGSFTPGEYSIQASYAYDGEPIYSSNGKPIDMDKSNILKSNQIKITIRTFTEKEKEEFDEYMKSMQPDEAYLVAKYGKDYNKKYEYLAAKLYEDYLIKYPDSPWANDIRMRLLHELPDTKKGLKKALEIQKDILESKTAHRWMKDTAVYGMAQIYYEDFNDIDKAIEVLRKYGTSDFNKRLLKDYERELKEKKEGKTNREDEEEPDDKPDQKNKPR